MATRFEQAPLAYGLSALAAGVYLIAAVSLARPSRAARRVAATACATELAGVLGVGTLSLTLPSAFPDESVWSAYGRGYAHLPLILPILGLAWLRRSRVHA